MTMATKKPRIQLILDFDGTMTTADTTAVIGARVLAKARELAHDGLAEEELPKPMQFYSEQYMQEYSRWRESHARPKGGQSIEDEVSHLSASKAVEQDSFLRVRSAALEIPGGMRELERNKALRDDSMTEAGRGSVRTGEVHIREPQILHNLIAKADEDGNSWSIVSVNWSQHFILGALIEAGLVDQSRAEAVANKIRCNELLAPLRLDHDGQPSIICTAKDKQDQLRDLLARLSPENGFIQNHAPVSSQDKDANITIYIGDSTTDIGCLAGPAIGMYLSAGKADDAVLQTFERLGIACLPVSSLPTTDAPRKLLDISKELESQGKPSHIVCSIHSLAELYEWLSNLT